MATLLQYFRGTATKWTVYNYYYICGNSAVGKELVLTDISNRAKVERADHFIFEVGKDSFDSIQSTLQIRGIYRRLIVLLDADKLTDEEWEWLENWYGFSATTTLVIVTNETSARKTNNATRYKWFVNNGKYVQCSKLLNEKSAKEFIEEYMDVTEMFATFMVEQFGFEPEALLREIHKLKVAHVKTVRDAVKLIEPIITGNYVDMLYARDPNLEKVVMNDYELEGFLTSVEQDLVYQAATISMARKNLHQFEMVARLGIDARRFPALAKRSARTNPGEVAARLELVTRAQHYFNELGARKGLKEWFIKMWRRTR